jgi:hypothetical protein
MQDRKRYRSRLESPQRKPTSSELTGCIERWDLTLPLPEDVCASPAYDDRVVAAAKAMRDGNEQMQLFMTWLVWSAGTYHNAFRLDPIAAAYAAGRRSVGLDVVKLLNRKTRSQTDSEQG